MSQIFNSEIIQDFSAFKTLANIDDMRGIVILRKALIKACEEYKNLFFDRLENVYFCSSFIEDLVYKDDLTKIYFDVKKNFLIRQEEIQRKLEESKLNENDSNKSPEDPNCKNKHGNRIKPNILKKSSENENENQKSKEVLAKKSACQLSSNSCSKLNFNDVDSDEEDKELLSIFNHNYDKKSVAVESISSKEKMEKPDISSICVNKEMTLVDGIHNETETAQVNKKLKNQKNKASTKSAQKNQEDLIQTHTFMPQYSLTNMNFSNNAPINYLHLSNVGSRLNNGYNNSFLNNFNANVFQTQNIINYQQINQNIPVSTYNPTMLPGVHPFNYNIQNINQPIFQLNQNFNNYSNRNFISIPCVKSHVNSEPFTNHSFNRNYNIQMKPNSGINENMGNMNSCYLK